MALVVQAVQAQSAADLVTAVNTYLATLTNPKINLIELAVDESTTTLGRTYRCLITTQTGGAAIGTPWTIAITEGQNVAAALPAITALIAATPAGFFAAPRLRNWYSNGNNLLARCAIMLVANATGGASANWLPL